MSNSTHLLNNAKAQKMLDKLVAEELAESDRLRSELAASQQAMQGLQEEVERGNMEIERLHIALRNYQQAFPDLSKDCDRLTQQLTTQRAAMQGLAEALKAYLDTNTTYLACDAKARAALAAAAPHLEDK